MTERLSTLLHDEALDLPVPPVPAAGILTAGRRQRRRRQATTVVASLATVAVLGGAAALGAEVLRPTGGPTVLAPATAPVDTWAVASGQEVLLGTGERVAVDGAVKSVYYTSAGILVRTGESATTDAPDSDYSLIAEDGETTSFDLSLGDRVPGTDPTLPYLAYVSPTDGPPDGPDAWQVVLRDVRTGEVEQTVPITGSFTWGGWAAPPVSLSGDHVYVGMDDVTLDVEWRTGRVTESEVLPGNRMPEVLGGRFVLERDAEQLPQVVDAQTGEELLDVGASEEWMLRLSLTGAHAVERPYAMCNVDNVCELNSARVTVHDLATGSAVEIDVQGAYGIGWTPGGDLVRVDVDSVDVCDPATGECTSTPAEISPTDLRVGGSVYEA